MDLRFLMFCVLMVSGCRREARPNEAQRDLRYDPMLRMLPAPPAGAGLSAAGQAAVFRGTELYDYLGTRARPLYERGLRAVARVLYNHPAAGRVRVELYRFDSARDAERGRSVFHARDKTERFYSSGRLRARAAAERLDAGGRAAALLDELIEAAEEEVISNQ